MGASESKLAFKEDIFRLAGDENIPAGSEWWDKVRCRHLSSFVVPCGPRKQHLPFDSCLRQTPPLLCQKRLGA